MSPPQLEAGAVSLEAEHMRFLVQACYAPQYLWGVAS